MTGTLDTVSLAAEDPHREQPWRDLGLKPDEYAQIREILGRRPTSSELAMYSVMWSEHCSYKSSKVHLDLVGVGDVLRDVERALLLQVVQGAPAAVRREGHRRD